MCQPGGGRQERNSVRIKDSMGAKLEGKEEGTYCTEEDVKVTHLYNSSPANDIEIHYSICGYDGDSIDTKGGHEHIWAVAAGERFLVAHMQRHVEDTNALY